MAPKPKKTLWRLLAARLSQNKHLFVEAMFTNEDFHVSYAQNLQPLNQPNTTWQAHRELW
jgi:hypothetical protein